MTTIYYTETEEGKLRALRKVKKTRRGWKPRKCKGANMTAKENLKRIAELAVSLNDVEKNLKDIGGKRKL